MDERIDCRSHAARDTDEQPTIHEGVIARALEQRSVISDRCELNRQIKADNKLLRELKAQIERLMKAVRNTIPAAAEAMETVRQNMLIFRYQLLHTRASRRKISDALNAVLPDFRKYIAALTEDMEELRSEKNMLLGQFDKADNAGMMEIGQWVDSLETSLHRLEQAEKRYTSELDTALAQYRNLQNQTSGLDAHELYAARMTLCPGETVNAIDRLKNVYGKQYDYSRMQQAERDVTDMLGETVKTPSIRQQFRELSNKQEPRRRKHKKQEQER